MLIKIYKMSSGKYEALVRDWVNGVSKAELKKEHDLSEYVYNKFCKTMKEKGYVRKSWAGTKTFLFEDWEREIISKKSSEPEPPIVSIPLSGQKNKKKKKNASVIQAQNVAKCTLDDDIQDALINHTDLKELDDKIRNLLANKSIRGDERHKLKQKQQEIWDLMQARYDAVEDE